MLRLVRDDGTFGPEVGARRRAGLITDDTVRIMAESVHKALTLLGLSARAGGMSHSQGVVPPPESPPFEAGVRAWMNDLTARGRVPATLAQYQEQINRIARESGWEAVADVTYESAIAWLAERRRGGWKGATYKRAATALRSFGKSLSKAGLTQGNVLEHIESAGIASGDGSRPLTIPEARAIIAAAKRAENESRRTRGFPALFYTFLCLTGFRYSEAADCRWGQVDLDGEFPCVWSNPAATKNKTRMAVALCPELLALLRKHRAGTLAHSETDPVFPCVPNRSTWHVHREAAGVQLQTRDGPASFHSCRKAFFVWLGEAGVPETVVEALARHVDSVGRKSYNRHFLASLSAAVQRLPILVEDSGAKSSWERPEMPYTPIVTRSEIGTHRMSTPASITTTSGTAPHAGSSAGSRLCDNSRAHSAGAAPQGAVMGFAANQGESAEGRFQLNALTESNPDDLADFLESIARLLRGRAAAGRSA